MNFWVDPPFWKKFIFFFLSSPACLRKTEYVASGLKKLTPSNLAAAPTWWCHFSWHVGMITRSLCYHSRSVDRVVAPGPGPGQGSAGDSAWDQAVTLTGATWIPGSVGQCRPNKSLLYYTLLKSGPLSTLYKRINKE